MANIGANGRMHLLLAMVLLGLSRMVGAADIIFYSHRGACSGSGYIFHGIGSRVCCIANGGSVLFRSMDGCMTSRVYKNGGCTSGHVGSHTGNVCYIGGGFTSGYWYYSCRRRSLLGEVDCDATKCVSQSKPTGVVFTEDATKGSWVLKSSNAVELLSQLENVSEGEKVNWLQANGAIFDASTAVATNVDLN